MRLTHRELSTVLAALRLYQRRPDLAEREALHLIASDSETIDPLDDHEIDDLCERINTGEVGPCE